MDSIFTLLTFSLQNRENKLIHEIALHEITQKTSHEASEYEWAARCKKTPNAE